MAKQLFLAIFSLLLLSCSAGKFQQKEQSVKLKNTGSHISIKLKINQYKEGNFYFDTASSWTIIDSSFYKDQEMAFNHLSSVGNNVVGNSSLKMTRVLDTITISTKNNTFFSKFNLIYNLKKFGKDIDGIVGISNFGNTPFKIDFISQKITFNPKINEGFREMPIKFDGYFVYVPAELVLKNGKIIKGDFVIDTGSKRTILTSDFAADDDILNSEKATYEKNALGGVETGYSLFASQFKIDQFKLTDCAVDVSRDATGALSKDKNYIGIIGNDVLDDFDIIYHPTQLKIYIKPNKNFNKPSEDLYKSLFLYEPADAKGWIVGAIYKESDAYKMGLRRKDEVIEINNKNIKNLNFDKFSKNFKPNQKLKLNVKRRNKYFEIDTYLNVFLKINN